MSPTGISDKQNMLKEYIARKKLKFSRQREEIAHIFFGIRGHMNLDELYRYATGLNPEISYTTVYRTLKLLTECGLAVERKFAGGQTRYENIEEGEHHDHLICSGCGRIMEFRDERIEQMQEEVAARYQFFIKDHTLEIYGECSECRKNEEAEKDQGHEEDPTGSKEKNHTDR